MLKTRMITAAILIPLMVGIIFYLPVKPFCFLTGLITMMATWEWTKLMGLQTLVSRLIYLGLMFVLFFAVFFVPIPMVLMFACGWWLCALLLICLYPRFSAWWGNNKWVRGLMGAIVLVPCWLGINYVRNLGNGSYTLLYLFILVWGADTVAYFVGKKWGKHKLAPNVSPGKSVQGAIGAIVFALLASVTIVYITEARSFLWPWLIGLTVITVVGSIVGDLFESMLKRNVDLKDSGSLLPGHGGLLDRIDSLTAAAPVYGFGVFLMMVMAY